MTHSTKQDLIAHYRKSYLGGSKSEKSRIINLISESASYSRKHIIALFNVKPKKKSKLKRNRASKYAHLLDILKKIWSFSNFICGKRLKPFMPNMLESLIRHNEINISDEDKKLIINMSAATIDRLLGVAKKENEIKGKSTTKPGTLLKHQIPIRTFADWNEKTPGFLEIDLVAHCGVSSRGEYLNTLTMTDINTSWTVCTAFMGKSQRFTVEAIVESKSFFPFPILGIDSDNGAEFINGNLSRYCIANKITFTRSRPYKKNDSAHVEQKNWDIVRKMIGYNRFDTYEQLEILKQIHLLLNYYQNYFQPSQKLALKTRIGSKITKKYDKAKTPMQRVIEHEATTEQTKKLLTENFRNLNPVKLIKDINKLVEQLIKL